MKAITEHVKRRKAMKVKIGWTNSRDDFMLSDMNGEWVITMKNELIHVGPHECFPKRVKKKEDFIVAGRAVYHTSDWLRFFCNEHHPEIDFDAEFETNKPGVFARYQEKFGHDYEDGVRALQYEALKKELLARGYELPWEDFGIQDS